MSLTLYIYVRKILCSIFGHLGATVSVIDTAVFPYLYTHDYCEFCSQKYAPGILP